MEATVGRGAALLALALAAAPTAAAEGLQVRSDSVMWPRWQARVGLTTTATQSETGSSLRDARLLGDYYFTGSGLGQRFAGGFRATSGFYAGSRSTSLSTPTLPSAAGLGLSLTSRTGLTAPQQGEAADGVSAVPYLGVGYTGMSLRGGWGFTADIGLIGAGVRFGRAPSAQRSVDDVLRELRLTPVLQLGVSYSF